MSARVLMVPGWTGSGPGHWQSLWQRERPQYARVDQRDWDQPEPAEWIAALDAAVAARADGVVLVAHSLGGVTLARWAAAHDVSAVRGALIVAPCDVEAPGLAPQLARFAPMPLARLPFPAHVVASTDDPFATAERSRAFARAWGAELTLLDGAGHIATSSGHGAWPDGLELLERLVTTWSAPGR